MARCGMVRCGHGETGASGDRSVGVRSHERVGHTARPKLGILGVGPTPSLAAILTLVRRTLPVGASRAWNLSNSVT